MFQNNAKVSSLLKMLKMAASVTVALQSAQHQRALFLVEEREEVVLRGALLVAVLGAGARRGGRRQVARTVQERQQIIRVHVVQLKPKSQD